MPEPDASVMGLVTSIRRYPVKSMMGEELDHALVTDHGVVGDRALALVDDETGKIASAKNPRRWPNLFEFRAALLDATGDRSALPQARITFPDGDLLTTDQPELDSRLSAAVGRSVHLARSAVEGATAEGYWPDHEWLAERDSFFEFPLPPGTFFDGATVHVLTTATLDQLQAIAPGSQFDPRRFRPNFVIKPAEGKTGFVENEWIGRSLTIGEVVLRIERPCFRCVMTTLSQSVLPKDSIVLRTVVQENEGNVGVYASVIRGGQVHRGDFASLT